MVFPHTHTTRVENMAESTSTSASGESSGDRPSTSEDTSDQVPDAVKQPIVSLLSRLERNIVSIREHSKEFHEHNRLIWKA